MKENELLLLTCDELAKMCKKKGITYYRGKTRLRKQEMVDLLLATEKPEPEPQNQPGENVKIIRDKKTDGYIDKAQIGSDIVFAKYNGILAVAKLQGIDKPHKTVSLENQYGKKFVVKYCDVYWVCTKKKFRIPSILFSALKNKTVVGK